MLGKCLKEKMMNCAKYCWLLKLAVIIGFHGMEAAVTLTSTISVDGRSDSPIGEYLRENRRRGI